MVTNEDRASWAQIALEAFAAETGQDTSGDMEADIGSVISDLLCDLMHLCRSGINEDQHGDVDFAKLLATAEMSFTAEVEDEEIEDASPAQLKKWAEIGAPIIGLMDGEGDSDEQS